MSKRLQPLKFETTNLKAWKGKGPIPKIKHHILLEYSCKKCGKLHRIKVNPNFLEDLAELMENKEIDWKTTIKIYNINKPEKTETHKIEEYKERLSFYLKKQV